MLNELSQAEICKGIISASHYSNIENGRYQPTIDILSLLAERLSVPVPYFTKSTEDNIQLEELLQVYEKKIKMEDTEKLNLFIQTNKKQFEFIPSLEQELNFNLLKFIHLVKASQIIEAKELYTQKIINMKNTQSTVNIPILHKYFYVSGLYYFFEREWSESLFFFKELLQISNDPLLKAKVSYNISLVSYNLFDYEEALQFAKEAKVMYLNLHRWEETGDCYNLIAVLLRENELFEESEIYLYKGLNIIGKDSNITRAKLHHNLALIKYNQGDYKEALEKIDTSIHIKEQTERNDLFISHRTRLNIFLKMEDTLSLKRELKIAQKHVQTSMDKAHFLFIKAQMHYLLEEFTYYEDSMKICVENYLLHKNWKNLKLAAEHYSTYLGEKKRYKQAFHYQKICTFALKKL